MPEYKKIFLFVVLVIRILYPVSAQDRQTEKSKADSILKKYGEVYLVVPVRSASGVYMLSRICSVDAVYHDSARICLNKLQYDRFLTSGIPFSVYEIVRPPEKKSAPAVWQGWNTYPAYGQYDSVMHAFAADFPQIARIDTLGYTVNNRLLLALKISDNVTQDEPEPEFMYSSTMHGDETGGYVLMLRLIDYLLNRYGTDTLVTMLVDSLEIWICPLANPDGTYYGGNNTVSGAIRYNANGADLNRNFPDPADGPHPDGNVYQPETQAMIDFHSARHIGMSANFHAGAEVVNFPWDTWVRWHADDAWFRLVSRVYADTVHQYSTGYMTGFDNGITNGAEWYSISGGRQDYVTYFREGRETTIELDINKITPEYELDTLWEYNYRSLLYYMHEALFGLEGFVTDSVTGRPVKAVITIPGHDADSSEIYSDSVYGYYHRYLAAGTYDLLVTADGYQTKSIPSVSVENHKVSHLDIALSPLANNIILSKKVFAAIYPNPVKTGQPVFLTFQIPGLYIYRFYSLTGIFLATGKIKVPYSGRLRFDIPQSVQPGAYLLVVSGMGGSVTLKILILP